MIVHAQSGIAHNYGHIHERRTMAMTELMLITEGDLYIRHIEDYHLSKGDVFLLPQGIEHYGTAPTDCIIHWHHFFLPTNSAIVEEKEIKQRQFNAETLVIPLQFNLKNSETVFLLGCQLQQYAADEDTQLIRNALVTAILAQVALEYRSRSISLAHKRLNSILSYIRNNFMHRNITVKSLAEFFNYNEKYICNLFKKHLGISPLQYIINQKLEDARRMLLNSSDTVEAIAISLNYDDPHYFMRQFKNRFGMTPSEFRKHYSNPLELHLGDTEPE